MKRLSLTPVQAKTLAFLKHEVERFGVAPSYPEIAVALGMSPNSKSVVHHIMRALEERGHIHRPTKHKARCLAFGPKPEPRRCPHCFHVVRA